MRLSNALSFDILPSLVCCYYFNISLSFSHTSFYVLLFYPSMFLHKADFSIPHLMLISHIHFICLFCMVIKIYFVPSADFSNSAFLLVSAHNLLICLESHM